MSPDLDLWHVLAQSGFSFGVAAFLLMRLEKELRALTKAIHGLRTCQVCKLSEPAVEEAKVK